MTILKAIIVEARYILQIRKQNNGYDLVLSLHIGSYADLTRPTRNEDTEEVVVENYSSFEGAKAEYDLMMAKLKSPSLIVEALKRKQ